MKRAVPLIAFSLLLLVNVAAPTMAFSTNSPLLPDAHLPLRHIAPQQGHQGGGGGGGKGGGGGSGGGSGSCTSTLPGAVGVAYTPSQIKTAYDYNGQYNGAGKTIAIIDAYGSSTLSSDLSCFDSTFGLPAATLSVVTPFGKVRGSNSNWGMETTLDVEWAHAMAPGASILLIITPSASLSYLINDAVPYAVNHGADVISMSWGSYEDQLSCTTWDQESAYFASAVSAGAIPVAASGDNGAFNGNTLSVLYPASDPNVVGTGGTSLTTSASGAYSSEVVWDTSPTEATGGGVSTCFPEPSYQSSAGVTVTSASGPQPANGRVVPDVSYDSDPNTGYWVYDTNGFTGWVQVGGTSAAAPQWSAIFADAESAGASISGTSIHGQIYSLTGTSIHDITSGNNNYYFATTGYDATTGVGSPVESAIVGAW